MYTGFLTLCRGFEKALFSSHANVILGCSSYMLSLPSAIQPDIHANILPAG